MTEVPPNNDSMFVEVLSQGGPIQVQSYPISELQSILGASLPQIVGPQPQIIISHTQLLGSTQPQIIVSQPQIVGSQPQIIVAQPPLQPSLSRTQPTEPLLQTQPYLEEQTSIKVKLEEVQDDQPKTEEQPREKAKQKKEIRTKCPIDPKCHVTFNSKERLIRHIRRHRGENAFQCHICDYSTYNKCLFEEHVRIHQGIKPFKCSICPYRSASKKNTKKHELIHRPDNPRKCDQCIFVARHVKGLEAHKKSEHGNKESENAHKETENALKNDVKKTEGSNEIITNFKCILCKIYLKDKADLKRHKKNHRRCSFCGNYFESVKKLTKHKHLMHPDYKEIVKKPELKEHYFKCAHCEWSSYNKVRILLHLIHHPDQEVDENLIDISVLRKHGIMK